MIATPTREEVRAAYDAIDADGPLADLTLRLGKIIMAYPELRRALDRIGPASGLEQGAAAGLILTGLNYGLRIGEARCQAIREKREV